MKKFLIWLFVLTAPFALSIRAANAEASNNTADLPDWPRQITTEKWIVTVYQPQTDHYADDKLDARAAVAIKPVDGSSEPVFGAIWLSARLDIDRDQRVIGVRELSIPEVRLADVSEEQRDALARLLETEIPKWELDLDLDLFVADLDEAVGYATTPGIKAEPPQILHANEPAVLLLYDGEPKTQKIDELPGIERVVNTVLPVLREAKGKTYYLYGGDKLWYGATDPLGPWTRTKSLPAAIERAVDGLELEQGLDPAVAASPPKIVVATKPTELVVTQGEPKWMPIGELDLLYCDNTDSDLFLDIASQRYFLLIAGRWYAGSGVADELTWVNVANDELPPGFASIPADSVNGHVLAHVAGTLQAREEALQNTIPQTAAVRRDDTSFTVSYDGEPAFEPVQDLLEVRYAVNTRASVFLANGTYWACDNAIWYQSSGAAGPWRVAAEIPAVLYRIPPSNPHHNVTYVHIYETTPKVVYVGYTPGYVGSYWYHGTIVYGTGWYYNPWYRTYYYPRPWTYGFNVRYDPWYGWGFGMTWSNGPFSFTISTGSWYRPPYYGGWYGPGGYRPPYYRPYPPPIYRKPRPTPYPANRPGAPGRPGLERPVQRPVDNLYGRPVNRDRMAQRPATTDRARPALLNEPNNLFTDKAGNVYRRDNDGAWQTRDSGRWAPANSLDKPTSRPITSPGRNPQPANRPATSVPGMTTPSTRPSNRPIQPSTRPQSSYSRPSPRSQLESDYRSRSRGTQRMQQRPSRQGSAGRIRR